MREDMTYPHITLNSRGVPHIDGTRHHVIAIIADHVVHGYSAAQIVEQYPDLTPAQVHAALTYYYDHPDAMDTALVASYAQAEHQRHHHTPHPKLVAARAAGRVMLRLYMHVHVKAAITVGIRRRGVDVMTAQEDGGARLEDVALLDRATALQRVLFSQDDDLLAIARERQATGVFFSGRIYGHQLAATVGKYVLDLELVCQVLDPEEMANRIEFLPLG